MIQPNELRIGNYFHPSSNSNGIIIPASGIVHRVGSVDKFGNISVIEHSSQSIMFTNKEVSPISITPEWLVRLGAYKYERGGKGQYDIGGYIIEPASEPALGYDVLQIHDDGVLGIAQLKYVHQLQNLIFALSDEELKLTP